MGGERIEVQTKRMVILILRGMDISKKRALFWLVEE